MIGLTTISLSEIGFIGGQQVLRSFSSIRASVRLHDGMITSLLYSPLSFFHKTPQVNWPTHLLRAACCVTLTVLWLIVDGR